MVELGVEHVQQHTGHRLLQFARFVIADTNERSLVIDLENQPLGTPVRPHFLESNAVHAISPIRNENHLFPGEVTQFKRLRERV